MTGLTQRAGCYSKDYTCLGPKPLGFLQAFLRWCSWQGEVVITLENNAVIPLGSDPVIPKSCPGPPCPPLQGPWGKNMTKKAQTAFLCPNPNIKSQWPRLDHVENLYHLGYEEPRSLPNMKLDLKFFCSARKHPIVHLPASEKRDTEITKTSETQITPQLKTHKLRPPCIEWHPTSCYQATGSAEPVLLARSPTSPPSFIPTTQASLLSPPPGPALTSLEPSQMPFHLPGRLFHFILIYFLPGTYDFLVTYDLFVFWLIVDLPY